MPDYNLRKLKEIRERVAQEKAAEAATESGTTDIDLTLFNDEQRSQLTKLKEHIADDVREEFTTQQLNHLRFMRWLVETGRLTDDTKDDTK